MTATETDAALVDEAGHVPGEIDMWFFVVFETLVFAAYFCVYLWFRTQNETSFLKAQAALTLPLGVVDTIILLTSSWSVARCVQHAAAARYREARRLAAATVALGVAFLALKLVEWVHLIAGGNTFTSSDFMTHYFFLTGMHTIHVLIGFVALGVLIYEISTPERRSRTIIETCSTYWHTVDLFWVLIFAMLYIVR